MIKELLHTYGTTRRRDFAHDRLSTLGSSSAGQCLRKTAFSVLSVPPDEGYTDTWGAAIRGSVIEDSYFVPALRASLTPPARLLFAGDEQVTMVDEEARLSATPDGLIVGLEPDCLSPLGIADIGCTCLQLECKSIDPRVLLRKAKPEHEFQLVMAMGLMRRCTDWAPQWGVISYINASFWDQVTEFPVRYDERVYAAGAERAAAVFACSESPLGPMELPPEGKLAGGDECKYCGFALRCGAVEVSRVPNGGNRLSDEDAVELKELRDLERGMAGACADNTEKRVWAQEAIKQFLHEHDVRAHKGDGWSVTWSTVKGRVTLDRKAAEAAGLDLSAYEQEGNASERLIVT